MYQLSHILIEQRNILATMTDGKTSSHLKAESLEAESTTATEDLENSHATRAVKEMVQGFNGNLEGKTFLNEGALIELTVMIIDPFKGSSFSSSTMYWLSAKWSMISRFSYTKAYSKN